MQLPYFYFIRVSSIFKEQSQLPIIRMKTKEKEIIKGNYGQPLIPIMEIITSLVETGIFKHLRRLRPWHNLNCNR